MVRMGLITIAISLTLSGCNGQTKDKGVAEAAKKDTPQVNIKVDKKYDKDGNLIKYDSTYASYYSNIKNDTLLRDSIFSNFRNYFHKNYSFSDRHFFNGFFFEDSLLPYDFYKRDFFSSRFRNNMQQMDPLFWEIDSLKNHFFSEQFKNNSQSKKNMNSNKAHL